MSANLEQHPDRLLVLRVTGGELKKSELDAVQPEFVQKIAGEGNILGSADEDYKKHYRYFSNRRHFTLPAGLAKLIGKPMLFSLSNGWAKFYQVDSHRKTEERQGEF